MARMGSVFGAIGGGETGDAGEGKEVTGGECIGVVERVIPLSRVAEAYEKFERGEWGKVVFDPWA